MAETVVGAGRVADPPADAGFAIGGDDPEPAAAADAHADAGAEAHGAADGGAGDGDGGAHDGAADGAVADGGGGAVGAGGGAGGGDDGDADSLGGDEHLQVHATDGNKQLDYNIRQKEKLLEQHKAANDEHQERIGIMVDHLKNVEDEHAHTQALVDAKGKEIQTETHLGKIAEREAARLQNEIQSLSKDLSTMRDRINALQTAKFDAKNKEEKFQKQMNWNEEELLQWSLALKQKNEDAEAVARYHKDDDAKAKALTLKLEKKAREVVEMKQRLDAEATETQSVQIELDKAADEFKKVHVERQDTVRQWDEAMRAINKRNDAIGQVSLELAKAKSVVREKSDEQARLATDMDSKKGGNTSAALKIQSLERMIEKKRTQLTADKKAVHDFEDEVGAQKSEHQKAESELNAARSAIGNLTKEKERRARELEEAELMLEHTKQQLKDEFKVTEGVEMESKTVDALFRSKTEQDVAINKRLEALKEAMFKHSHELFTLRKTEADLIAEISGAQGTSRNLQARIHELDQRSLKQQEMLYNIEFQVQQLERKVAFASGKRSLEETLALNQRIEELKGILESHSSQHGMLTGQVKKLHDELRVARRKYTDAVKQKEELTERLVAIDVENESVGGEVSKLNTAKEALIVQHDSMKLEVKKLRDVLNARADQVFALENRKLGLELSMKEKEKEIALHREVQKAQVKAAEENRHMLAMDLKERLIKVEKLKAKYETIAAKLQKEDEDKSQAYYIIKAAQEREELQKEGDELNLTIRHTEKEIRGLTRMLKTLNQRNSDVRESLQKADADGPLAKLHGDLNAQTRSIADTLNRKKTALREVAIDLEHRRNTLGQLVNGIGQISREIDEKKKELLQIKAAAKEQEAAIKRSEVVMLSKREEYRKKAGLLTDADHSAEELYMALEEQRKKNRVFMDLIRQWAAKNGLETYANDVLESVGLEAVSRPMSAASATSARSDSKQQPYVGPAAGAAMGAAVPVRAMELKDAAAAGAGKGAALGSGPRGSQSGRPPVVARPPSGTNRPPSAGAPKLPPVAGVSVAAGAASAGTGMSPGRPGSAKRVGASPQTPKSLAARPPSGGKKL